MSLRTLLVFMAFAALLFAVACSTSRPTPEPPAAESLRAPKARVGAPAAASFNCGGNTVTFGPTILSDVTQPVPSQGDFDCFAWSEFISLNWPASAVDGGVDAGFGTPGDLNPTQWQTFMSEAELFPPDGGAPPAWGSSEEVTPECLSEAGLTAEQARHMLPLMMISKFSTQFRPSDSAQAFPFNAPSWLGARNGTAVWYEVRVSQPEYNFVASNGLYTANGQQAWVDGGTGKAFQLPEGSGTNIGAMELKASWMEVTEPQDTKWNRYKLTSAIVPDPVTQKCRATTVALVGLHIIHKTANQPTWIWATFEHVDNAPNNATNVDAGTTDWNFYNPSCKSQTFTNVPAQCTLDGGSSVTVTCTPNTAPSYYLGQGCPAPTPIQVTRMTPIDSLASSTNQLAQQAIDNNYPGSVWQNYQLINVLWSTTPTTVTAPIHVCQPPYTSSCLTFQSPQPSSGTVIANTTMETYFQRVPGNPYQASNCIACHANATLATTSSTQNSLWSSDFSFIFGTAVDTAAGAQQNNLKRARVRQPPLFRRIIR